MREDYIRTARAKGLVNRLIVNRHALKNAMLPVVTLIGIEFAFLIGGLVVTEQVFNINGVGRLFVQAVQNQDYTLSQALVMLTVTVFVLTNLAVDLMTPATPRSSPTTARPSRRRRWLKPLLNGEIRSAFSMSEPTGGSDPLTFKTRAELDRRRVGDQRREVVLQRLALRPSVLVVYAVTDPDAKDPYRRTSIFLVPTKTPRASRSCATSASATPARAAATAICATPTSGAPGRPARRPRRRLHDRPDPPVRRPGAPRHAHGRRLPARAST